MKAFFIKYKWICIGVLAAAVILTVAFVTGGSLNREPAPQAVTTPATTTAPAATEASAATFASQPSSAAQPTMQATTQMTTPAATQPTTKAEAASQAQPATVMPQAAMTAPKPTDAYRTESVPEGKPQPQEPQEQTIIPEKHTCTFSVSCASVLAQKDTLSASVKEVVPDDGVILPPLSLSFNEGESVFDVLARVCREQHIHMEYTNTPIYNSAYIEGIGNLYEFDCGAGSGWMYRVNGWFPNYGSSRYAVKDGDVIEWLYTCDLGRDIGGNYGAQTGE